MLHFLLQYTESHFTDAPVLAADTLCPWTQLCSQQQCKTQTLFFSKNTEAVHGQPDSARTTHPSGGVEALSVLQSLVCYSQDGLPP